jgi:hypothetical protein
VPPNPPNITDWLQGIGTVLAFGVTGAGLLWELSSRRREKARSQVDLVGVWCVPKYERRGPTDPRVEEGSLEWFVRNGSQLPIQVAQLAYEVRSRWLVRDLTQWLADRPGAPEWAVGPWGIGLGTDPVRTYMEGIRVPPQDTWHQENGVNVAHQAPDHADQLDMIDGLNYEIRWVLLVDNAGRRWEMRPGTGRRTKRVRWYSRRRREYPLAWRRPSTLWLNRKRYEALEHGKRAGRFSVRQMQRAGRFSIR